MFVDGLAYDWTPAALPSCVQAGIAILDSPAMGKKEVRIMRVMSWIPGYRGLVHREGMLDWYHDAVKVDPVVVAACSRRKLHRDNTLAPSGPRNIISWHTLAATTKVQRLIVTSLYTLYTSISRLQSSHLGRCEMDGAADIRSHHRH